MTTTTPNRMTPALVLHARTAADLMTPDPKSIRQNATVAEAAAFFCTRGFSAAPVIDEAGRPIGVVSRTDLLHRQGRRADGTEPGDRILVQNVMTPAVFCIHADTPAAKVVEKMLGFNVRRLFVVDYAGVLVGVISAFDVLRGFGRPFRGAG